MMGMSSAIRWWEESQLRALVLSSAFLQLFLFLTATKRPLRIPSWFRLCIWLAFLGSDAAAIYALATLFNRHKAPVDGSGCAVAAGSILELLWAPALLIHLGGPITISAYNMEDNELWRRHILTLLSQVTVALYVFCKSWPADGDMLLLWAAVLLFAIGIIRFSVKPWALKRASINDLALSRASVIGRRKVFRLYDSLSACWTMWTSDAVFWETQRRRMDHQKDYYVQEVAAASLVAELENFNDISLEEYVRQAKVRVGGAATEKVTGTTSVRVQPRVVRGPYSRETPLLLADRFVPYSRRLNALESFLLEVGADERVYRALDAMLSRMFNLLYTKEKILVPNGGCTLCYLTTALSFAVIGLFVKVARKDDVYSEGDVIVTYILLCGIAVMELSQHVPFGCLLLWQRFCSPRVIEVAQHSIMSFVARTQRPSKLMMLAALVGCEDYINMYWHVGHRSSSLRITRLVLRQLEDGWKEYIHDAASFRRFNDRRGQWTLNSRRGHHLLQGSHGHVVRRSLQVPFDESVLLWHIATELCFHHPDAAAHPPPSQESPAAVSREISNYMVYLLLLRPEMMMPGTRQDLFWSACFHLELMLRYVEEPPLDERGLAQGIVHKTRLLPRLLDDDSAGALLREAFGLAEALMQLRDEEERWKLVEGVWVEMLCYSASRCRGYLHAKSLGEGGEFLSHVWLLVSQMGMESFADRFQRPEAPEEHATAAGVGGGSTSRPPPPQQVPPALEEITTA